MSGVEIRVRANAAQAQREIRKTGNTLKGLETQAAQITKTFQRMAIGLTAVFAGGGITKGINNAADAMIGLNNRVKLVTKDAITTQKTVKDLFDIAARSGGSIDAAAETFNRFGLALRGSGKSVDQLLVVTEAVQKAAIISGSGAESAKAAIIQLGQGLASGQLRGQELNSVLEQMPRLAQAIAEGMDIPFGKLRENAAEGKITAEAVFQALIDGAVKIDEEFATLQFTTADLATVMKNELTRAVSEFDKVTGFSEDFKSGILLLTGVFRFLGQNIERWSILTQLSFLIVESQAKDFFRGLLDLFRGDFDAAGLGKRLGESIRTAFADAKNFGIQKVELALDFSVKKYDLIKSMFPDGTAGIYSTLLTFKENIVKIFKTMWKAIVGDSWWTSIFLTGHSQSTEGTIGNTSGWGKGLNAASAYISSWSSSIVGFFEGLHFEALDAWQLLVTDIESQGFKATASQRLVAPLKDAFDDALYEMATAYNVFALSPAGMKISLPTTAELEESWNNTLDRMETSFDNVIEALKKQPIVIGTTVAFESITDNLAEITKGIEDFFSENSAELTTAVSIGMAAALNKGLRTSLVRAAIPAGLLAAIGGLGQNQDFLNAVGNTARAWGETFKNLISGDGDVLDNILEGLTNVFSEIGTGFVDGLFGEDFESAFVDSAATALSAALVALAVAPGLVAGTVRFAGDLAGMLIDKKKLSAGMSTAIGSATSGLAGKIKSNAVGLGAGLIGGFAGAELGSSVAESLGLEDDGLFALGIEMGFAITLGMAAQMASAAAVTKIVAAVRGMALAASMNTALMGAGFSLGKSLQVGIVSGIKGGFVAALVAAVSLAVTDSAQKISTSAFNKIGQIATGKTAEQQASDRLGDEITTGDLTQIAVGQIVLEDLPTSDIERLAAEIGGVSRYAVEIPSTIGGLLTATSDFEAAVDKLTKEIARRGLAIPVSPDQNDRSLGFWATGGYVTGAGTGTSDEIPAMLSNGEYVIKAAAVDRIGKTKLDLMNQGILPRFAKGGIVGRAEREIKDSFARGDTALAMEIIGLVDQLGRLDEVTADLTDEMTAAVKAVAKNAAETKAAEDRDKGIEDLKQAFNNRLAESISGVLHGGSWKDALHGLLDSVTSNIINNFSQGLAESITKDLSFPKIFDGLSGIFNLGGSAGGGFGGILGSIAGFFGLGLNQGGIVPNTTYSQVGKDSVPAMLTPGEVVLSKNDVSRMDNNKGSTQSFNINITGDVSRQTRQEIVKMIPQITSGVNSQNKEANYRR
jgi:tape measure domain-containing protein